MRLKKSWKLIFSLTWLVITIAFAIWWLVNGLHLLELNSSLSVSEVNRYRFMLISEGITWMILLLLGGLTLIYFIINESRKNEVTKKFVASFSHDLKTSIASMRLQAESLKEDVKDPESQVLIKRLVDDSLRLQVQLENSLEFASHKKISLHMEEVNLKKLINSLSYHWPDINLQLLSPEAYIHADKRALDIIMRNLIFNAKVHAEAKTVRLELLKEAGRTILQIKNDGAPFTGDINKLGDLYYRHNPSSGSGLGLYVVKSLMQLMSGDVNFKSKPFTIQLLFNEVKG